jgi:hypothetical protein
MASTSEAYPGVEHRRLLLLTPLYLLVLDDLRSEAEHRYDWWYHHRGPAVRSDVAAVPGASKLGDDYQGHEYVQNLRSGHDEKPAAVSFPSPEVTTWLLMDPKGHTRIWTGDGPGESVTDRVPFAMFSRRGENAAFAAVLEPVGNGQAREVESVELHPKDTGWEIEIVTRDATERLMLSREGTFEFHRDDAVLLKRR